MKVFDWMSIRGIIQIGANDGTELYEFQHYTKNIILFEPIFKARVELLRKLRERNIDNIFVFDYVVSDKDEMFCDFFEGTESGNSSLFDLNPERSDAHVCNNHERSIVCQSLSLDTFRELNKKLFEIYPFNFLYMDVQGAEHLVLSGGGKILNELIDYVWLEVSHEEVYLGTLLFDQMIAEMEKYGFYLAYYEKSESNIGQGDALFTKDISRKILNV